MIDYRIILSTMIEDGDFPGWIENAPPDGREVGWIFGPDGQGGEIPYDYDSMDWRDTEFVKPSQATMDAIWTGQPERFDLVFIKAIFIETLPAGGGDVYSVEVTKPYNIDGATELTITINDAPLPSPTALDTPVEITFTTDVVIGILEDRPHTEIQIEVK